MAEFFNTIDPKETCGTSGARVRAANEASALLQQNPTMVTFVAHVVALFTEAPSDRKPGALVWRRHQIPQYRAATLLTSSTDPNGDCGGGGTQHARLHRAVAEPPFPVALLEAVLVAASADRLQWKLVEFLVDREVGCGRCTLSRGVEDNQPAPIDLVLETPVVSAALISSRLRITQRAALGFPRNSAYGDDRAVAPAWSVA
jgi:hypothetical protein